MRPTRASLSRAEAAPPSDIEVDKSRLSDRSLAYIGSESVAAVLAFLAVAIRAAPLQTPPTTLSLIVPVFALAVAAVGIEFRREAVRANETGVEIPVHSAGMILLLPALLLTGLHAGLTAAVFAFVSWRAAGQPGYRLIHEFSSSVLKVSAAALAAGLFSTQTGQFGPQVIAAYVAGALVLWIVEAATSATMDHFESGRTDSKHLRESATLVSRLAGVCLVFLFVYLFNPILTLGVLPVVALVYSEQRIRHLSTRSPVDDKTGLATSSAFTERLNQEIRRSERSGQPLSLVVIDLDHFKSINTRFGHLGGDEALAHIADRLRTVSRKSDLVVRWGGDELAWVMTDCPSAAAFSAAESFRQQISRTPFILAGQNATLTLSIGVAAWRPGLGTAELFKRADQALYKSKELGRNTTTLYNPVGVSGPAADA